MSSPRWSSVAPASASASSTVRLPSRMSPPTGLPVAELEPMTSIRSSVSWNANPNGSPTASAHDRACSGGYPAASIASSNGAMVV